MGNIFGNTPTEKKKLSYSQIKKAVLECELNKDGDPCKRALKELEVDEI